MRGCLCRRWILLLVRTSGYLDMAGNGNVFKKCPCCKKVWDTRGRFLTDTSIRLEGYQANFIELEAGVFIFTHNVESCGTSMAIEVHDFRDLYAGEVFEKRMTGCDVCKGLCLRRDDLSPCAAKCECAFVRQIIQIVKQWPKAA